MFDDDPIESLPEEPRTPNFDFSDMGKEALQLIKEYIPVHRFDKEKSEAWAAEQLRLLALAEQEGDTDFIRDYPRSMILLAKAEGVEIKRGQERLLRDRFLLLTRLVIRIVAKV